MYAALFTFSGRGFSLRKPDISHTHYTYTQLPHFQHCSYNSQYKEWNKLLPIYSYYVTAKTKKTSSLRKSSLYTYGAALRIRTVDLLFTKQLL